MNREPPIYLPPPPKTPIWPIVRDFLAAIGAICLVAIMIFVAVEFGWALQCLVEQKCS